MATLISFSQLNKTWKIAAGGGVTLLAVGGIVTTLLTKNSAGIPTRTEYSDGSSTQSGTLTVKSGSLAVNLRANGDAIFQGTMSGNHLYAGTMSGAGLASCSDGSTSKLLWNSTTQRFSCGTDSIGAGSSNWSNTGSLQTAFDSRYVNTSGDTMTGQLTIGLTSGSTGLRILQTASGNIIHAEKNLTSSGTIQAVGNISANALISFVGYSANPQLTAADTTSGLHFDGPGIVSIHNGGTQTMLLSSTNRVGIGSGSPETKLEVVGTISGSQIFSTGILSASGGIISETSVSGATLKGFGLGSCSNGTTSKVLYNNSTNTFSCGTDTDTDTNTTYTAGQGLTLTSTSFKLSSALSGTTITAYGTLSGNYVHAEKGLSSSGTLVVVGNTGVKGTLSGKTLNIMNNTSYILGSVGIGTTAPKSKLDVVGTISGKTLVISGNGSFTGSLVTKGNLSGASLNVMNLKSCTNLQTNSAGALACNSSTYQTTALAEDNVWVGNGVTVATAIPSCSGANNALLYNTSTNAFSCGTPAGTTYTAGQGLTLTSTSFKTNAILTGTTLRGWTTISGAVLHADNTLSSSGGLVWESAASGATLVVSGQFSGVGLTDCDVAGTSKLLWDITTKRFSCGTDQGGLTYAAAEGIFVNQGGDTMTGALNINANLTVRGTSSGTTVSAGGGFASIYTANDSGEFLLKWLNGNTFLNSYSSGGFGYLDLLTPTGLAGFNYQVSKTSNYMQIYTGAIVPFSVVNTEESAALKVVGSISGTTLIISRNGSFSGSLVIVGNETVRGTSSGNIIHAEKTLTSSGTITAEGTISGSVVVGRQLSGALLKAKNISPLVIPVIITGTGTSVPSTGSGKIRITVPDTASGFLLYKGVITVDKAGVTNTTCVQVRDLQKGKRKMFSTPPTIDSTESGSVTGATPYVVNAANADVGGGDYLYVDICGVSTTAPKGLQLQLYFTAP